MQFLLCVCASELGQRKKDRAMAWPSLDTHRKKGILNGIKKRISAVWVIAQILLLTTKKTRENGVIPSINSFIATPTVASESQLRMRGKLHAAMQSIIQGYFYVRLGGEEKSNIVLPTLVHTQMNCWKKKFM